MIDQFIQEVVQLIHTLPPISIYLVFFFIAYIENIIPPIPGDVLIAFGGYLAAESVIELFPVYMLTTIASVFGFMSMYWIGSRWGERIKRKEQFWLIRFIPVKYFNKVHAWMQRWGMKVILANRFLAGTRSVIALTAGLSHMRMGYTILCSAISSLLWNGILLAFGLIVHNNWQLIGEYLSIYGQIILGIIVLVILLKLSSPFFNKNRHH